jgi:glycosyltransferase involved in cell wall biosynthesis
MARVLRRYARRVIAVSESARDHHLEHGRMRPERVITLYNGIDIVAFGSVAAGAREAVRDELGLPDSAPVLATVAIQREPKGIQHMLEALPAVIAAVPDARYLLIGDGPHRNRLEEITAAIGLTDRVLFAGSRDDIPRMLSAADLFVLPTLTEALPTVIAEAMAAGLPIVASAVGGIPEMVSHGDTALLVPPADPGALTDAVVRILTNPRQAAAMGRAGRRVAAEQFDVVRQAGILAEEYRHLVRGGSR